MNTKKIVNFIFELGMLKKVRHSGWQLVGIKNPDTIAEHALLAAQIGYILAVMEGDVNPEKVTTMLVIHDNVETRTGDPNKINSRYFDKKPAEEKAIKEQLDNLGEVIKKKWLAYFEEFEMRNTKEGVIAKDADWLEMAFQAKEYYDCGYKAVIDWINNVEKAVETRSAKLIIKEMKKTEFTAWFRNLQKMTYTKLKK